jgi:hypothetical protein
MGYSPSPNTVASGNFYNALAIFYERKAVPNLKASTPALSCTKQWPLPMHSGNTIQFFSYNLLPANLNQASEGFVGSPISESTTRIQAVIGQYADYVNSSDLLMETALDDNGLLANLSNELNYRLALTLNNLVLIAANSLSGTDSTVSVTLGAGTYVTAQLVRWSDSPPGDS